MTEEGITAAALSLLVGDRPWILCVGTDAIDMGDGAELWSWMTYATGALSTKDVRRVITELVESFDDDEQQLEGLA